VQGRLVGEFFRQPAAEDGRRSLIGVFEAPPEAMRVPRGKTGGTQRVALPEGYLDHLDDDTPPGVEAEAADSGG